MPYIFTIVDSFNPKFFFAFPHPQSQIPNPKSQIPNPKLSISSPQSSIFIPQSSILNPDLRRFFAARIHQTIAPESAL
jgi:hypothetical protein